MGRRHRILATLVLAAGAVASIATSQVDDSLQESQDLPPQTLDEARPLIGFQIFTVVRGSFDQPTGFVTANLTFEMPGFALEPAEIQVQLLDGATSVILDEATGTIPAGERVTLGVSTEPFGDCDGLCERDFILWIERGALTDTNYPSMVAESTVMVELDEGDGETPSDATLSLDVTPLEAP